MLGVRLLGGFDIKSGKKGVSLTSRRAQSLFAFLILNAGTPQRREKLAGLLWPDSTEESARDYLRHALWLIRKALPDAASVEYLQADDLTVGFDAAADYWLDVAAVRDADETGTSDALVEALSAYRGELLPGFYDEWVVMEREQVQAAFERKVQCLLDRLLEEGRWEAALEWGEKWIALGQKPEAAYRAIMSAYAAKGDMAKAAAAYERCVRSLQEYGVEPSEQTRLLHDDLRSGAWTPPIVQSAQKTHLAPQAGTQRSNLPVPLTSLIGRERELKEIARLLSECRLLTLTGPGGVGKTRLAIQAASNSLPKFRDGVFWVGLVGLSDPNLIPQETSYALQIHEIPNEPLIKTISDHLSGRHALLVLDNCEHLIRACAQFAEELLGACPKLKILTTSTEALGLFNETIWQVPSLSLPEQRTSMPLAELRQYASIELFRARAANAKAEFALTEENGDSVAQICQRLDGIPLAIELAAARVKVLSAREIAARLDDRFSLLTAGSRTAIARHQTLRATIDWSHELLSEPERILFRRLAAFAGGFTLAAAEAVCEANELKPGEVLDSLGRLVDKSLVIVENQSVAGQTRYHLLETIRQYALEKLVAAGEAQHVRGRHAEFYVRLAEQAEPTFYGNQAAAWFRRLDQELDNIRSAIDWSTSNGRADTSLRMLGALVYFWFAHGLVGSEWNDRVQEALSRPEGRQRTQARAKALNGIGFMYWSDIYPSDRRAELDEALSIGRELGDGWNEAVALRNLGLQENLLGNYPEARSFLMQSLSIFDQLGPSQAMGRANTLIFLGDVAFNQGDWEATHSLFEEAAGILRGPGDMNFLAYAVRRLAQLAWQAGDLDTAFAQCKESLRLNQLVGDPRGEIACLAAFAAIAMRRREFERAATLMAAVEAELGVRSLSLLYIDRVEFQKNQAEVRAALSTKTLEKAWARGKALSFGEAVAAALGEPAARRASPSK